MTPIILSTIAGTLAGLAIGVPLGFFSAVGDLDSDGCGRTPPGFIHAERRADEACRSIRRPVTSSRAAAARRASGRHWRAAAVRFLWGLR